MHDNQESLMIDRLMAESGVKFGTSGARGLADAMTDRICYAYTKAFLQYLAQQGELRAGMDVVIAGDYRPSTPRVIAACVQAIQDQGLRPLNGGFIPTPALALYGISHGIPSIMVTGSHIPDDRNGIKFNKAAGEILKPDEEGIRAQQVSVAPGLFDEQGGLCQPCTLPPERPEPYLDYCRRYLDFFPADALAGLRVGLYEHSSVAREALGEVLEGLGAELIRLGRSERFIPVDTEAVREEDVRLARQWVAEYELDALVSTDGDGDRPLLSDEAGNWLRGDVAGILCARQLGIRQLVTPVSSNSAVEKSGWFDRVVRTRIGSPYVIAAMEAALDDGGTGVAGYEANGGFLLADRLTLDGRELPPLPTRDAVIVILAILAAARQQRVPVSGLLAGLPSRFTSSGRLQAFPTEISRQRIAALHTGDAGQDRAAIEALFGADFGSMAGLDDTDGLRITFDSGEVVHLRPSGNAPELRCYNEADTPQRAAEMNRICLQILDRWRDG